MKITRKEFAEILTHKQSIFAGITRDFDLDYIRDVIREQVETIKRDGIIVNKRIGTLHSTYLEFTGGSRLDIAGREFYKVDCGNSIALICRECGLNCWNEQYDKSMVYVVEM